MSNEPDFRKRADLMDTQEPAKWFELWMGLAKEAEAAGCTFVRFTVVNDDFPEGDTPHGAYLEGWLTQPSEQPKFAWPADA